MLPLVLVILEWNILLGFIGLIEILIILLYLSGK